MDSFLATLPRGEAGACTHSHLETHGYTLVGADLDNFRKLYAKEIIAGRQTFVTEFFQKNDVRPFTLDVDIKYNDDRLRGYNHISRKRICGLIDAITEKYYSQKFDIYFFEKCHVGLTKDSLKKDGFHVWVPELRVTKAMSMRFREEMMRSYSFRALVAETRTVDGGTMIDPGVSGFRMLGSVKSQKMGGYKPSAMRLNYVRSSDGSSQFVRGACDTNNLGDTVLDAAKIVFGRIFYSKPGALYHLLCKFTTLVSGEVTKTTYIVKVPPAPKTKTKPNVNVSKSKRASYELVCAAIERLQDRHYEYDTWLKIGIALHSTGEPWAFDVWDEWSSRDTKAKRYDSRRTRALWDTFYDGQITIGTLFYYAKSG